MPAAAADRRSTPRWRPGRPRFGVQPGDGLLLSELRGQQRGLNDLVRAMESSGIEPAEVKSAIDRLVKAGLAEPVGLASATGP